MRRHAPTGQYRACHSDEAVASDAAHARKWLDAGRDVFLYFNNDIDGYAIDNAQQLIAALQVR